MIDFLSNKSLLIFLLGIFGILSSCDAVKTQQGISEQARENANAIIALHETTLEASRGFYTSPLGFLYALCFLWVTYLTVKILFSSQKGTIQEI
tara:strand:+ start:28410 stop:28691 length:282 start_codon:yes stop_codon:yes gene_type:complete